MYKPDLGILLETELSIFLKMVLALVGRGNCWARAANNVGRRG